MYARALPCLARRRGQRIEQVTAAAGACAGAGGRQHAHRGPPHAAAPAEAAPGAGPSPGATCAAAPARPPAPRTAPALHHCMRRDGPTPRPLHGTGRACGGAPCGGVASQARRSHHRSQTYGLENLLLRSGTVVTVRVYTDASTSKWTKMLVKSCRKQCREMKLFDPLWPADGGAAVLQAGRAGGWVGWAPGRPAPEQQAAAGSGRGGGAAAAPCRRRGWWARRLRRPRRPPCGRPAAGAPTPPCAGWCAPAFPPAPAPWASCPQPAQAPQPTQAHRANVIPGLSSSRSLRPYSPTAHVPTRRRGTNVMLS